MSSDNDLVFLREIQERLIKFREGDSKELEMVETMISDWIAELEGVCDGKNHYHD